jgi:hypothetical protein
VRITRDANGRQEASSGADGVAYGAYATYDANPEEDERDDVPQDEQTAMKRGKSTRKLLADLVAEETNSFKTAFRSADGHTYVRMLSSARAETLAVQTSGDFAEWLTRTAYDLAGIVPSENAVKDTVRLLEAKAASNPPQEAALRVARRGNDIYIDMADAEGRVIVAKPTGWRVVSTRWNPLKADEDGVDARQIPFHRPATMLPLPEPRHDVTPTTLEKLFTQLLPGVSVTHRPLILLWLLGALKPGGPYPVLALHGPEGAGKSVAADMLQGLIDPTTATRRNLSSRGEPRGLFIAARNGHVLAFDNISGQFSADQSDALCQLSSGGTYASRAHYTNDDEHLVKVARPLILNGIDNAETRQDLLSRVVLVEMAAISEDARKTEADMMATFKELHSEFLGALLDALVVALAAEARGDVVGKLPRLADVAAFVLPAENALGLAPGAMRAALAHREDDVSDAALDANPLARAVIRFLQDGKPMPGTCCAHDTEGKWLAPHSWQGTLEELGKNLAAVADQMDDVLRRSAAWPHGLNALKSHLRRCESLLTRHGVTMTRKPTKTVRYRVLTYTPPADMPDTLQEPHTGEVDDDDLPF